ncbi:MAG: hypothetical protein IPI73_16640 [Betaproteobacteria bacterium]|nr:hypothetical protein [Betaproteobacteria bacterium]
MLLVVLLVAADAGRRRIVVEVVLVAVLAGDVYVLEAQRETCLAVVEASLLPRRLGVAIGALNAERFLVLVVLAVAVVAGSRRAAELLARGVAGLALDARVRPGEQEVRLRVVERPFVEARDLHVASLVIGVTGAAWLRLRAAMESLLRADVTGDILVAVQAQLVLRRLVELHMAVPALLLVLRMARDDLARHQHALDGLRAGGRSQPCCRGNE